MKVLVTNYTFNAAAGTITFTDYGSILLESVLVITNVTDQEIIYNFADATKGGTVATNVLTLEYDTSSMANGDDLQIWYYDTSLQSLTTGSRVNTELPEAAALADNTANPTVPGVAAFNMAWDGATWDRAPGTAADGFLVNLGANNDVTVTGTVAVTQSGTWDEVGINDSGNSITVDDGGATLSIDDGGGSITVDGTVAISGFVTISDISVVADGADDLSNAINELVTASFLYGFDGTTWDRIRNGGGTEATALRVTIASDSTGVLSIDDNGGSITVDGTVTETNSAAALTALQLIDNAVSGTGFNISQVNGEAVDVGAGTEAAAIRVTLPTNGTGILAGVTTVTTLTGTTTLTPGTGATNLGKAIDSAGGATDTGVAELAIRDDALTTLTPVDGDYVANRVNARGAKWVAIEDGAGGQITSFGGGTEYTEDAAAAANPVGGATILVRQDTPASEVSANGDNIAQRATAYGAAYTQIVSSTGTFIDTFGGGTEVAEDSAHSSGVLGGVPMAVRRDSPTPLAGTDNDYIPLTTDANGALHVNLATKLDATNDSVAVGSRTSGGLTIFRSIDLDETEEEIKGTAGQLYGYYFMNLAATTLFLKFYNATAASVTVGTTTPVLTIPVPAGAAGHVSFPQGIAFATAISAAVVTGVADASTGAPGANEFVLNAFYT